MNRLFAFLSITLSIIGVASAEWLPEATVRTAAEAFPATDAIGSSVLDGRTVSGLAPRGRLWIVALEPSGHIVMSGSDLANPIVGFSKNDFVEPDPKSPAFAVLEGASASVEALESKGGTRHARWDALLGTGTRGGLRRAAASPEPETVIVEPFLDTHYDQCQPYNDYAPVHSATPGAEDASRGRTPCGCVATAAAQMLKYFQWPARIDKTLSYDHVFTETNNVKHAYAIRFDGHVPFDWGLMDTSYGNYTLTDWIPDPDNPGYYYKEPIFDLRGNVAESERYPIARLILFCDVLAHMKFSPDASNSNYRFVAQNLIDWYTEGHWVDKSSNYSQVKEDLKAGIPLQVELLLAKGGHHVVASGWAEDGEEKCIYLNFGWGGANDGYYNLNGEAGMALNGICVGHYPRAKPQLDPLPKVCEKTMTLSWHFPDIYSDKVSGFSVTTQKWDDEPSDFIDNFSASTGIPEEDVCVTNVIYDHWGNVLLSGNNVLRAKSCSPSSYTFPEKYTLTPASVLTFNLRSYFALRTVFEIQARFDDGEWETIGIPDLCLDKDSGWRTECIELGGRSGRTAQFKIVTSWQAGDYYDAGCVLLDDFKLTNVLKLGEPTNCRVDASARSCELFGLEAGASYVFNVTPDISGALAEGETSEPISARTADEMHPARDFPEITSVSHTTSEVVDGLFSECSMGGNVFVVTCSWSVVSLEAHASAATLIPDSAINVTGLGAGRFIVEVNGDGIPEYAERTRTILTLAATDGNGSTAYRDLSLRFSTETEPDVYVPVEPGEYAVSVGDKGDIEETAVAYVVTAKDGVTLTAADFDFGSVSKEAYDIVIAPGGKSATVTLKKPVFGVAYVEAEAEKDPDDPSGFLVVVDESLLDDIPDHAEYEAVSALPVKAFPGLCYQAGWGSSLDKLTYGRKVKVPAEKSTLYLGVIRQTGPSAFYKLTVSDKGE